MFVRNTWYVAAFSHECTDRPLARTILGEPVVLFRTPDGAGVALQDRCCHRFAPPAGSHPRPRRCSPQAL